MPSNKGLWTLPLPPNLAPLQCARALPAASAVAWAAPAPPPGRPGRRSPSVLAPPRRAGRASRPGQRAGGEPGVKEGWPGSAAAPFPAETPLLGLGPRARATARRCHRARDAPGDQNQNWALTRCCGGGSGCALRLGGDSRVRDWVLGRV